MSVEAKTQHGVVLGKNHHAYPLIVHLGIERTNEMDAAEVLSCSIGLQNSVAEGDRQENHIEPVPYIEKDKAKRSYLPSEHIYPDADFARTTPS